MNKVCVFLLLLLLLVPIQSLAQTSENEKDIIKEKFTVGTIVSIKDNIACYRLKGNKKRGMYGFCKYDNQYTPLFTSESETWTEDEGVTKKILNSQCYTIIAPCFDYALPFSDGWSAVCINKKWSYISEKGEMLCDFVLDSAYPFKDGKTKVMYQNEEYIIDKTGKGLPSGVSLGAKSVEIEIASKTINQLVNEGQYEKTIELGNQFLERIMPKGDIYDTPKEYVLPIIRVIFATNGAKNNMMSLFNQRSPELFHISKLLPTYRAFSYLQGSPMLLSANLRILLSNIDINDLPQDVLSCLQRSDYKQAVVKFEKRFHKKSLSESMPSLILLYHNILALAGDFESVNRYSISLAKIELSDTGMDEYSIAVYHALLKQYQTAILTFNKAISSNKSDKYLQGLCYHNIALIYSDLKMNKEAQQYFRKAYNCYRNQRNVPLQLETLSELLNDSANLGKEEIANLLEEYKKLEIDFNVESFKQLDTNQLNKLWGQSQYRINKVLVSLIHNEDLEERGKAIAYELTVFKKTFIQDMQMAWQQLAYNSDDTDIQNLLIKYNSSRAQNRGIDIFDLDNDSAYENIKPIMELERTIKSKVYCPGNDFDVPKYIFAESVINNLNEDDIAIEVFTYDDVDMYERYGAWVLSKDKACPQFVKIINADSCSIYTTDFRYNKTRDAIHSIFSSEFGNEIWKDFVNLDKYRNIFLSPAGILSEIGIEYIPVSGKSINEVYNFHRLRTTSSLSGKKKLQAANRIELFGGLDYGTSNNAISRGISHSGYLKYSKKEIDDIKNCMNEKFKVNSYIEKEGTKSKFLSISQEDANIIHVATHGWQQNRPVNINAFLYSDRFNYYRQNTELEDADWLMYTSGLCMSKNDELTDSLCNILYASEVAQSKLNNTTLVVLSACNTIAGSNADGYSCTLGLNYALQCAGAKNIISSLWNVDDAKTYEFMTTFYKNILETENIYEAFRQTHLNTKEKYPLNPEYWAAFVLQENF